MGIDTVQLNGEPFTVFVKEGQQVGCGQMLAKVNLESLKASGKEADMIVVFTNPDKIDTFSVTTGQDGEVNEIIGTVTSK